MNEPVPINTLSIDSSQPINTLSESPLSIINPESPLGSPVVPLESSINLSVITVFVVDTEVVVPLTVKSPVIIKLSFIVVSDVEPPILIIVPLTVKFPGIVKPPSFFKRKASLSELLTLLPFSFKLNTKSLPVITPSESTIDSTIIEPAEFPWVVV